MRFSVVLALTFAVGCRREPATPEPDPSILPSAQAPPPSAQPPRASSAPGVAANSSGPSAALGRPAPVGGAWLSCYGSFAPRANPELDVERLGQACGPSNGMVKVEAFAGELHGEAGSREHRHAVRAGECLRVFAVGDPKIHDLDVEVLDSRGRRVAFDEGDDRWPIVEPDGPYCAFEATEHTILVRASHGAGRYAVELWRLAPVSGEALCHPLVAGSVTPL